MIAMLCRPLRPCLAFLLAVCSVTMLPAYSARAEPPAMSKVVQTLYNGAQKEFDAANFEKAAQLFVQVWRQGKTIPVALYNAARSYHLAGKLDQAEELYREYLALPEGEAATKTKVQAKLVELRQARADAYAEDAVRAEKAGNFALAVKMWAEAFAINPKPAWILKQARAEHLAGNKDAALKGYDKYLALPADQAPDQKDAARWRAEIAPRSFAEVPVPKDPPPVVTIKPAEKPSALPAWACLGGGALLGVAGVLTYASTADDRKQFDSDTAAKTAGKITGTSKEEAQAMADRINSRVHTAWALGGAGAVAAGVGVYLLARPVPSVAVAPTANGLLLAWRF